LIGIKKPGPYLGKVKLHLIAQVSRNTTQAVKGIYFQESYGKNLLYEHKVICQDVFKQGGKTGFRACSGRIKTKPLENPTDFPGAKKGRQKARIAFY